MELSIEHSVLLRLREGDSKAFEIVFRSYYKYIHAFVSNTLFNKIDAKDITQSVFMSLWEHRKEIDPNKNIGNFLYTIARNMVYRQTERLILQNKYQDYAKELPVENLNIEDEIDNHFFKRLISVFIEELPPARKTIFLLSWSKGMSNKEIAQQLFLSEKTVETQIRRSLIHLKEKIKYYLIIFLFIFLNG